ncbi:hypothetical protein C8R43DRAFT_1231587 [Mycena crocata]|nr:hypothetical protein C8R43DRAFT_1231587 [Mycena crocata]
MSALHLPNAKNPQERQRGPYSVSVSTIADLGKNYTQEEMQKYQHQLRITRRSSFKNIKGCSEAVWSLPLEGALLQGLFHHSLLYVDGTERAHERKKIINRNSFISKFIFETTNQIRTAKQVGSRLQQLAGTTRDDRVIRILRRRPIPEAEVRPLTTTRPLITASDSANGLNGKLIRVFSTVVLQSARYPSLPPEITLVPSLQSIQLRTLAEFQPQTQILGGMDPAVVLLSPIPLAAHSTFEVYKDKKPYWSSPTSLVPDGIQNGHWRYLSSVAADLWPVMSEAPHRHDGKRTQWSISQTLFRLAPQSKEPHIPFARILYEFDLPTTIQTDVKPRRIQPVLSRGRKGRKASAPKKSLKCIPFSPPPPMTTPPRTVDMSREILPTGAFNLNQFALSTDQKPTTPAKFAADVYSRDSIYGISSNSTSISYNYNHGGDGFSSLADWNKLAIGPSGTPRSYCDVTQLNFFKPATTATFYSPTGYLNDIHTFPAVQSDAVVYHDVYNTSHIQQARQSPGAWAYDGKFMGLYPIHEY